MPSVNSDIIPSSAGFSLGQPLQRWNASLNIVTANSFMVTPVAGFSYSPSGVLNVNATPITVNANSTAAQDLMSVSIPAGALNSIGRVLRVRCMGTWTTQSGQTPTMTMALYLGSVPLTSPTSAALTANTAFGAWQIQMDAIVFNPGTSATIEQASMYSVGIYPTGVVTQDASSHGLRGPVDIASAETFQVRVTFSTNTSPANICVQRSMIVEVLN